MATKAKRREFDQVLTFQGRHGTSFLTVDDEKRVDDATRVGVRVKLVPAGRLKAFRAKSRDWASTTLEDGRLLAVSLVPRHFSDETRIEKIPDRLDAFGIEEGEDPEWVADARELREKLLAFLEGLPKTTYLQATIGGNGTGSFCVAYGECSLIMAIGRDPSS